MDELYRLELGMETPEIFAGGASDENGTSADSDTASPKLDPARGWQADRFKGVDRLALYGTADGKRNAFVRIPSHRIAVIILSDAESLDARKIADRILERLIPR